MSRSLGPAFYFILLFHNQYVRISVSGVVERFLLCLLQPAGHVDYRRLLERGSKKTREGYRLLGMCYNDACLYTVEGLHVESGRYSCCLVVYQLQSDTGNISLLDEFDLGIIGWLQWPVCPRTEYHTQRVFVPNPDSGVTVARLDGGRLLREKTLTCVKGCYSVEVMPLDTVYVCHSDSHNVSVVGVRHDSITSTLERPGSVGDKDPFSLAVLGESVLVGYTDYNGRALVLYRHGSPAPVRVIPRPREMEGLAAISTDCWRHFLVADHVTKTLCLSWTSMEICITE